MRKEEWNRYFYGIQKKLLFSQMILLLLFISLLTLVLGSFIGKKTKVNLVEKYGYVNERFSLAFQNVYGYLETVTENCIINENIQNSLKNRELNAYEKEVISNTLQFVDDSNVEAYYYIDNKNNVYTRDNRKFSVESLKNSYFYKGLGSDYSKVKLFWEEDLFSGSDQKALFAGRYVRPIEREYRPGVIYMKLEGSCFQKVMKETGDDSAAYFVVDSKGEVVFSQYPKDWNLKSSEQNNVSDAIRQFCLTPSGEGIDGVTIPEGVLYLEKHKKSGFSTAVFIDNHLIYQVMRQSFEMIAFVFLIVSVLAVFFSKYWALKFSRPIRYISELMENFDDERLQVTAHLETNTELDEIGNSYNKMLTHIGNLLDQVKFKERELRKAEMDTLLYQMHPHFLYNTLDTIYMLARIQKEETIMKMVQALSDYLRINLSNGAEEISVADELRHVQAYMQIQNIRKGDLYEYQISADEKVKSLPVIKMILQPIVENCMKHAFEGEEGEFLIRIKVLEMDGDVVFTVSNNGRVMSEKEMQRLNRLESVDLNGIDSVVTKSQGGFGVYNVVKRLRIRYREQIRFYYVVSAQETTCVIRIKKELMKSDE